MLPKPLHIIASPLIIATPLVVVVAVAVPAHLASPLILALQGVLTVHTTYGGHPQMKTLVLNVISLCC